MLLWQPGVISLLVMPRQSGRRKETHLWRPRRAGGGRGPSATPVGSARCQDVFLRRLCVPRGPLPAFLPLLTAVSPPRSCWSCPSPRQPVGCTMHNELPSSCWGTGKHFISWVKRAPCEQVSEQQNDPPPPGLAYSIARDMAPEKRLSARATEPPGFARLISHPQRLVMPGWSSRGCPGSHHRATPPVPPPPPFPGQHICRNECPQHSLGQIHVGVKPLVVSHTLHFSWAQLTAQLSPPASSPRRDFESSCKASVLRCPQQH